MPAILIALVVIVCVVLAFLNFMPFTNKQVQATEPPEKKDQQATEQQKTPILTRLELENRLKKLAESEPPKELFMGAMCYDMAAPPARVEYVCPDCGEKTFYVQDYENKVKPKKKTASGGEAVRRQAETAVCRDEPTPEPGMTSTPLERLQNTGTTPH